VESIYHLDEPEKSEKRKITKENRRLQIFKLVISLASMEKTVTNSEFQSKTKLPRKEQ
jgi:hypothetical protein